MDVELTLVGSLSLLLLASLLGLMPCGVSLGGTLLWGCGSAFLGFSNHCLALASSLSFGERVRFLGGAIACGGGVFGRDLLGSLAF